MRTIRKCTNSQSLGITYQGELLGHQEEYALCRYCKNNISGGENCLARISLKEWCSKWSTSAIVVGCPAFCSNETKKEELRIGEPGKIPLLNLVFQLQNFVTVLSRIKSRIQGCVDKRRSPGWRKSPG